VSTLRKTNYINTVGDSMKYSLLVSTFFLLGCPLGESTPPEYETKSYDLGRLDRFENKEVVCYSGHYSLDCHWKENP